MSENCLHRCGMIFFWLFLSSAAVGIQGHGRLMDPPSRSSMWRVGYHTPINYNDNQLYCGGRGHKCGICGDPFNGSRDNEAGGKYAKGIITRYYKQGQVITADVDITTNHLGWFEFKICPNNNVSKPATPQCLNKHVLEMADGSGSRYKVTDSRNGHFLVKLKLPDDVICSQCVFQWKYHAGNSWVHGCLGCGVQEEFYGCADVAILDHGVPLPTSHKPGGGHITKRPDQGIHCFATGTWAGNFQKDVWCRTNCLIGNCPSATCKCR